MTLFLKFSKNLPSLRPAAASACELLNEPSTTSIPKGGNVKQHKERVKKQRTTSNELLAHKADGKS